MLKHQDIWRAVDFLAQQYGLSASGLARKAGLDPTTFNKSKRVTREGKARWPSTESIAKILEATDSELTDFIGYIEDNENQPQTKNIPLIGIAQAGSQGFFDDAGFPIGGSWDEIPFPDVADSNAYALEIQGASMQPVYRDGDLVLVSPVANIRRGDRVIVKTKEGEVLAKQLLRRSARKIELQSLNPDYEDRAFDMEQILWIHRIIWASQ
jgi:phage repressor protein C with HTH and peptisase S24 domain